MRRQQKGADTAQPIKEKAQTAQPEKTQTQSGQDK
jgi:hypothetical protein